MKVCQYFLILAVTCSGKVSCDSIDPSNTYLLAKEGENVTMSCSFMSNYKGTIYLYWYRMSAYGRLEYILRKANTGSYGDIPPFSSFAKDKYWSDFNLTTITLTITKLKLEDSTTYHCAVERTQCHSTRESSYINLAE
ncbi:hypothetical protein XELAEV_18007276mg [Xenopus laevis]|uniref:Ig-like domain-containing protein n=1 Tax=Xenopus laevis TaxID=8355 RepID=A0A974E087_XENLA|nr:hypothetical protein XELAEV_18007276mg [Xenopus laevis]